MADTLVTPLNDSFVDFDLLARIDSDGEKILGPSVYAEMVWTARQLRAQAGLRPSTGSCCATGWDPRPW
jgi:chromosome partitioning protein